MKRKYKSKSETQKRIARERILELFEEAEKVFKKHPERADRYVELARKIAMKYKIRLQKELKKRFCKHCYKYLMPGANCRVRLNKEKVVYYCFHCKKYMRFPY
jgi:ribonuclease P protein subunit RPR2